MRLRRALTYSYCILQRSPTAPSLQRIDPPPLFLSLPSPPSLCLVIAAACMCVRVRREWGRRSLLSGWVPSPAAYYPAATDPPLISCRRWTTPAHHSIIYNPVDGLLQRYQPTHLPIHLSIHWTSAMLDPAHSPLSPPGASWTAAHFTPTNSDHPNGAIYPPPILYPSIKSSSLVFLLSTRARPPAGFPLGG